MPRRPMYYFLSGVSFLYLVVGAMLLTSCSYPVTQPAAQIPSVTALPPTASIVPTVTPTRLPPTSTPAPSVTPVPTETVIQSLVQPTAVATATEIPGPKLWFNLNPIIATYGTPDCADSSFQGMVYSHDSSYAEAGIISGTLSLKNLETGEVVTNGLNEGGYTGICIPAGKYEVRVNAHLHLAESNTVLDVGRDPAEKINWIIDIQPKTTLNWEWDIVWSINKPEEQIYDN